ncbi:MAG: MBL fold metallo-hydrolase [Actinomycetota bacterium]|nr:MBL fold metallo-hydrolase [Actinomycetota bacterium]
MQAIDVRHLGHERVICCWRVGDVLIDPGPESSCAAVLDALAGDAPRALLLTHIHLDHAGAAGALVRRWPELEVYVHERGARHLADPAKLVASASQLYGEENMERLWGEIVPVPQENLRSLSGGETLEGGFRVTYTPGHASHHVAYLHEESGRAFVGDVGGVRIAPAELTLPPTPPPDVDLEAWNASLSTIAEWRPESLGITHFGAIETPFEQLAVMRDRLAAWATLAREFDAEAFESHIYEEIAAGTSDEPTATAYEQAVPPNQQFLGLDRYWRKRDEG